MLVGAFTGSKVLGGYILNIFGGKTKSCCSCVVSDSPDFSCEGDSTAVVVSDRLALSSDFSGETFGRKLNLFNMVMPAAVKLDCGSDGG